MRHWVLGVVALACATAGCSSTAADEPPTSKRTVPKELTAKAALGDLHSLDACSLIEPDTFTKFGNATYGPHHSLDQCDVEVGSSSQPVVVSAGRMHAIADISQWTGGKRLRELAGDLSVAQGEQAADHCVQYVVFPDDVAMAVDAYVYADRTVTEDLCGMVAAGIDGVVDVLTAGTVRHRDLADNSFGLLDACAVAQQSGVAPDGMKSLPSGHHCTWTFTGQSPSSIDLTFGTTVATSEQGDDIVEGYVDGRRTLTLVFEGSCEMWTEHIAVETEGQEASGHVETAVTTAYGSTDTEEDVTALCLAALDLAKKVWPALPAT